MGTDEVIYDIDLDSQDILIKIFITAIVTVKLSHPSPGLGARQLSKIFSAI